jgi:gliding motility-associatede transport system auxiliary component
VRPLQRYVGLLLNVIGLLCLLAIVVAISYQHNLRLDLTPAKAYTLSAHSQNIIDHITQPVKIVAFVRKEDPHNEFLSDLFWRIRLRQPKITTQIYDLNRNPGVARAYRADAYGSVIVECGPRRKSFSNIREEVLMATILQVTRDYEKTVYLLTGHGEHDITDSDRNKGYTTLSNVLEQEFYHVKTLSLFGDEPIPKDAAAIIVAGPRGNLRPEEAQKLDEYLRAGGSLLMMVDPENAQSTAAFLRRYRVDLQAAVVSEPANRLAASEMLTAKIPDRSKDSAVTLALDADPVFSLFGPVQALPGDTEDIDVIPLLMTSKSSWSIPLRGGQVPDDLDFDAKRGDERGPFPAGLSVAVRLAGASHDEVQDEESRNAGRMIVYGDSDFANNFFIDLLGNRDLLVNSVNWLALEDTLIGVRPERKVGGKEQFFVSSRQNYMVFLLGVVIEPAIFLLIGAAVFVRRRMS